jgi:hypothetical protein
MKTVSRIALIMVLIFGATGCVGFWTMVGTTIYMKSNKHHTVTVRLKADPAAVYAAMLKVTERNGVEIKENDPEKFLVAGLRGEQYASCFVEDIGNSMSQLLVTVDVMKEKTHEAFALQIVNNICSEVGEKCELKE